MTPRAPARNIRGMASRRGSGILSISGMRYWAHIEGMTVGPFTRDELLLVPGFDGSTPVCPEDRDGEAPDDWMLAKDMLAFLHSGGAVPATEPSPAELFQELQGKLEQFQQTILRLESEKAAKDEAIAAQRAEIVRLGDELKVVKAQLALTDKAARARVDELMVRQERHERAERELEEALLREESEPESSAPRIEALTSRLDLVRRELSQVKADIERRARELAGGTPGGEASRGPEPGA